MKLHLCLWVTVGTVEEHHKWNCCDVNIDFLGESKARNKFKRMTAFAAHKNLGGKCDIIHEERNKGGRIELKVIGRCWR